MNIDSLFDGFGFSIQVFPDRILLRCPRRPFLLVVIQPYFHRCGYRHNIHTWYKDSMNAVHVVVLHPETETKTFVVNRLHLKDEIVHLLAPKRAFAKEICCQRGNTVSLFSYCWYRLSSQELRWVRSVLH